jgi:hypothetical protein
VLELKCWSSGAGPQMLKLRYWTSGAGAQVNLSSPPPFNAVSLFPMCHTNNIWPAECNWSENVLSLLHWASYNNVQMFNVPKGKRSG